MDEQIRILLVEDNPSDVVLVRNALKEYEFGTYVLDIANTLSICHAKIFESSFDVVILDLGLPDSQGQDTLRSVVKEHPDVALVVFTSLNDTEMGLWAIRNGAQDYLYKSNIRHGAMAKSILYSIERQRQRSLHLREQKFMEHFGAPLTTRISSEVYSNGPLFEIMPGEAAKIVADYQTILDGALEHLLLKGVDISEKCRDIGERLGFLGANPRDVVEVHRRALERSIAGVSGRKASAYADEGRMVALQVMGYLAAFYRKYAIFPNGGKSVSKPRKETKGNG